MEVRRTIRHATRRPRKRSGTFQKKGGHSRVPSDSPSKLISVRNFEGSGRNHLPREAGEAAAVTAIRRRLRSDQPPRALRPDQRPKQRMQLVFIGRITHFQLRNRPRQPG